MGFEPQAFRPTVRRANHCATGAGLEYISILLLFEIKWILYEIVTNWNKLPFLKLPLDLVYIFQCSDA